MAKPREQGPEHEQARAAWEALAQLGGISSAAQLGQRWGISTRAAENLTRAAGFPEPVAEVGGRRWLTAEADDYRRRYIQAGAGKVGRPAGPTGERPA